MIFTSPLKRSGRHPRAVAICRGLPAWYHGAVYDPLRPSRAMLKLDDAAFREAYEVLLAALDADQVAGDVGAGAVLLCWEADPAQCHRAMVSAWLTNAGYVISELPPAIDRRIPLFTMDLS